MDTIKVVCGIIFRNNQILICRRKPEKALGGFWEFPGGKVEEGEEHKQTLARELMEELGMQVSVLDHYVTIIHQYEKFTIELIAFTCHYLSASLTMLDHDAIEWVDPRQLLNWNLAAADIPIAQKIAKDGEGLIST